MSSTLSERRLVVLAHGSTDQRWQLHFSELARDLQERLGSDAVRIAYMEFATPTLAQVAEEAGMDNKRQLLVLPFFLAPGAHLTIDIPAQMAQVRWRFPHLQIELAPPVGAS